jgi:hypothetical protein
MRAGFADWRCPKASFWWQRGLCQHLPRAFEIACGPLGLKGVSFLMENTSSGRFSAWSSPPGQPSSSLWNSVLRRLATIFPRLEPAGLLYMEHFAGKCPGDTSNQSGLLCLSIATELGWLVAEYVRKICHSLGCHQWAIAKKNEVYMNRWTVNMPTYTNLYSVHTKKHAVAEK